MSLLLLAPLAAAPDRVLEFGAVHEAIDMRTSYSTMGGGPEWLAGVTAYTSFDQTGRMPEYSPTPAPPVPGKTCRYWKGSFTDGAWFDGSVTQPDGSHPVLEVQPSVEFIQPDEPYMCGCWDLYHKSVGHDTRSSTACGIAPDGDGCNCAESAAPQGPKMPGEEGALEAQQGRLFYLHLHAQTPPGTVHLRTEYGGLTTVEVKLIFDPSVCRPVPETNEDNLPWYKPLPNEPLMVQGEWYPLKVAYDEGFVGVSAAAEQIVLLPSRSSCSASSPPSERNCVFTKFGQYSVPRSKAEDWDGHLGWIAMKAVGSGKCVTSSKHTAFYGGGGLHNIVGRNMDFTAAGSERVTDRALDLKGTTLNVKTVSKGKKCENALDLYRSNSKLEQCEDALPAKPTKKQRRKCTRLKSQLKKNLCKKNTCSKTVPECK